MLKSLYSIILPIPVFLYLWNIVLAYNNIANVSRIFYLFSVVHFSFLFADIFTNGLYVSDLYESIARGAEIVKNLLFSWFFRETQTIRCSLTNRLKPRQWNNPEKKTKSLFCRQRDAGNVSLKKYRYACIASRFMKYIRQYWHAAHPQVFHS